MLRILLWGHCDLFPWLCYEWFWFFLGVAVGAFGFWLWIRLRGRGKPPGGPSGPMPPDGPGPR